MAHPNAGTLQRTVSQMRAAPPQQTLCSRSRTWQWRPLRHLQWHCAPAGPPARGSGGAPHPPPTPHSTQRLTAMALQGGKQQCSINTRTQQSLLGGAHLSGLSARLVPGSLSSTYQTGRSTPCRAHSTSHQGVPADSKAFRPILIAKAVAVEGQSLKRAMRLRRHITSSEAQTTPWACNRYLRNAIGEQLQRSIVQLGLTEHQCVQACVYQQHLGQRLHGTVVL